MPRTRYVFFALLACLEHLEKTDKKFINECKGWLLCAKNKDGGWGHVANDEDSKLYPTAMTLLVLDRLCLKDELSPGCHWIISHMKADGWGFSQNEPSSPVATAIAIVALRRFKGMDDQLFIKPKERLLIIDTWGVETEDMPGTPWIHCSYMWVFPALTHLGVEPYSKPIAQGVRELNKLNCKDGWKEPSNHLTVRGQFWATFALHNLQLAYDPAVHTYRIDSALSVSNIQEPHFVTIFPHSKWSFVLPKFAYQAATYTLLAMSVAAFFGIHRLAQAIPRKAELFLAVGGFLTTYQLIQKRKMLFPGWVLKIAIGVITVLSSIDLVFGLSVSHLFDYVTIAIKRILSQ